jgi:hypothetical protein
VRRGWRRCAALETCPPYPAREVARPRLTRPTDTPRWAALTWTIRCDLIRSSPSTMAISQTVCQSVYLSIHTSWCLNAANQGHDFFCCTYQVLYPSPHHGPLSHDHLLLSVQSRRQGRAPIPSVAFSSLLSPVLLLHSWVSSVATCRIQILPQEAAIEPTLTGLGLGGGRDDTSFLPHTPSPAHPRRPSRSVLH